LKNKNLPSRTLSLITFADKNLPSLCSEEPFFARVKMNIIYHKGLKPQKWYSMNLFEQMANIGSEVERTIKWRKKIPKYSQLAFERMLELIDLTVSDPKNKNRLKEILRVRETLADYFTGENIYKSSDRLWQNYFYGFNYAARI